MIPFSSQPQTVFLHQGVEIACFDIGGPNLDSEIVRSFGSEWSRFAWFSDSSIEVSAAEYFEIIPKGVLDGINHALDVGCGSGRWSRYLSARVGFVEAVDPSEAVLGAALLNRDRRNVRVTRASIDAIPFADSSFDLAICLGVIHHLPDPAVALRRVVEKVRLGGHVLVYVYYSLEQRGPLYRGLFHVADLVRRIVSRLPPPAKGLVCDILAFSVYLPLVGLARLATSVGGGHKSTEDMPLAYYRNKSLREIRTDSLDRFGTAVERRFSREEFITMMKQSGLSDVVVSPNAPFWHGVGRRAS